MQPMGQGPSMKMWWIVGVVVVLAFAGWYFYGGKVSTGTEPSPTEQATIPALSGGDTTADISADLNATPDTSAALDADAAASAQAVSGF